MYRDENIPAIVSEELWDKAHDLLVAHFEYELIVA